MFSFQSPTAILTRLNLFPNQLYPQEKKKGEKKTEQQTNRSGGGEEKRGSAIE